MKRFLLKSFWLSALILVLAFGVDRLVCRGLLKMDDYRFFDYRAMLQGGMDNDILIIGNSRGKSHFDTRVIDSLSQKQSFNIGIGGYPINAQLLNELYREHNRKPDLIIQNIDYLTIRVMSDIRNQHESEQFFPLVYDKVMRKSLRNSGYGFLELNMPLYRFFGYQKVVKKGLLEALQIKHFGSYSSDNKGFLPENGRWDGTVLQRMKPDSISLSEEGKALLEGYLAQCHADSIQVVLVNSPMFTEAQKKLIGYDDARSYFEQVSEKYDCVYLDYTDTPVCHDTSNFVVSVHLNVRAARQFTETLIEDLKSLNIIE